MYSCGSNKHTVWKEMVKVKYPAEKHQFYSNRCLWKKNTASGLYLSAYFPIVISGHKIPRMTEFEKYYKKITTIWYNTLILYNRQMTKTLRCENVWATET